MRRRKSVEEKMQQTSHFSDSLFSSFPDGKEGEEGKRTRYLNTHTESLIFQSVFLFLVVEKEKTNRKRKRKTRTDGRVFRVEIRRRFFPLSLQQTG